LTRNSSSSDWSRFSVNPRAYTGDPKNTYRPDMKTYTFKVSRHDSHKKVVAKIENMKGVKEAKWNPRTREVTVIYDANVTSVRNIKHFMA